MRARILLFLVLGLAFVSFAQGPYLLVIDASGSMDDFMPGSEETKMDVARIAAKDFVDKTSGEIGIVVFEDCDYDEDPYTGDIRLTQSFTTDKVLLKSRIDELEPRWDTPIADALAESKSYIESSSGHGTIILITDGEETCGGDPVDVASRIYNNKTGTVHVVGYLVGGEAEAKARLIAAAGGGKYYSANSTVELKQALADIGEGSLWDICPGGILMLLLVLGSRL